MQMSAKQKGMSGATRPMNRKLKALASRILDVLGPEPMQPKEIKKALGGYRGTIFATLKDPLGALGLVELFDPSRKTRDPGNGYIRTPRGDLWAVRGEVLAKIDEVLRKVS